MNLHDSYSAYNKNIGQDICVDLLATTPPPFGGRVTENGSGGRRLKVCLNSYKIIEGNVNTYTIVYNSVIRYDIDAIKTARSFGCFWGIYYFSMCKTLYPEYTTVEKEIYRRGKSFTCTMMS